MGNLVDTLESVTGTKSKEPPSLTFRTNFTPAITFNPFSKSDVPGSPLTKLLQPSIDGVLPIVGEVHYAPFGQPSGYGMILIYAGAALALYGAFKLLSK